MLKMNNDEFNVPSAAGNLDDSATTEKEEMLDSFQILQDAWQGDEPCDLEEESEEDCVADNALIEKSIEKLANTEELADAAKKDIETKGANEESDSISKEILEKLPSDQRVRSILSSRKMRMMITELVDDPTRQRYRQLIQDGLFQDYVDIVLDIVKPK